MKYLNLKKRICLCFSIFNPNFYFMKKVILDKGSSVTEIHSKGNSFIEKALYLIHLTDWASLFIAEKKQIDPVEIRVIDALKDHLATIK